MRIAFSGVSSTGKSTLARAVHQKLLGLGLQEISLVDEGMKNVYENRRAQGTAVPKFEEMPDAQKLEFQEEMIRNRCRAEFNCANFVGDGSPLDCMAFYMEWLSRLLRTPSDDISAMLYRAVYRHDIIFHCPFGVINVEDDRRRFTDRVFLRKMDYILQGLTSTVCGGAHMGCPQVVKVQTISLESRVEEVIATICRRDLLTRLAGSPSVTA